MPDVTPAPADQCFRQDGTRLDISPMLARGTEPFWSARIDGRCVVYATPENVRGVRVWTRYHSGENGKVWSGALDGRLFELVLRPHPGCSDGMSDESYPIAARLSVGGEQRVGCARLRRPMPDP